MKKYILLLIFLILAFPLVQDKILPQKEIILPIVESIDGRPVRPTDVYYLAKSIDDSLIEMHDLYTFFDKEKIAATIKPRGVFQRVVFIAEEFNNLHPMMMGKKPVKEEFLVKFHELERTEAEPKHVYSVLNLMKQFLVSKDEFIEYKGEKIEKQPSDVYHMLRQISFHYSEMVNKKNPLSLNSPERVFNINYFQMNALLMQMAVKYKIPRKPYSFPLEAAIGKKPKDVYALMYSLHEKLEKYYHMTNPGFSSVELNRLIEVDKITPDEVFDISQIILGELKSVYGNPPEIKKQELAQYYNWKNKKGSIRPGDVYNLIERNNLIMDKILEKLENFDQ